MRPAEIFLPTRSLASLMLSSVRTAIPELSGWVERMRVLAARNTISRPFPRATIGSKIEPPPTSALPPNTASIAIAPCGTVVQVTLMLSAAQDPAWRATRAGVKLGTRMIAIRTLAGCCAGASWAAAAIAAATSPHFTIVRIIDVSPLLRSLFLSRRMSFSEKPVSTFPGHALVAPAALSVPTQRARLCQQEHTVEQIAEHGKREDARVHVRHLERALRQQSEIAKAIVGHDHLAEDRQDQRDREADAHAREDLRACRREYELAEGLQRGETERARGVELHPVDRAHAAVGVEQDREERRQQDEHHLHLVADAHEQHEDREIGRAGNRAKHFDQRLEQIVERPEVAHDEPEPDAEHDGESVSEHLPPERRENVLGQRAVEHVLGPRFEDAGHRRPCRRNDDVHGRELPDEQKQHDQDHAGDARVPQYCVDLHGTFSRPAITCLAMLR